MGSNQHQHEGGPESITENSGRTQPLQTALSKEPDITAVAAPCANSEDVLKIIKPRRSHDSQATLSDTEHDGRADSHLRDRSRAPSASQSVLLEAVKVPRGQRRGLFARFALVAEVTNPYAYSRRLKWWLTFVISVAGSAAPMATGIILPALVHIARDFDSTPTVVNLSVSLFMLSMSIFPLWWSSFSETLGRRTTYLVSFTLYFIFSVLAAISSNIGMFIAMRILSGGAAASVQAVGAGTIADIWESKERGQAMGMFYLGPLCGPVSSIPISFLDHLGHEWCFFARHLSNLADLVPGVSS